MDQIDGMVEVLASRECDYQRPLVDEWVVVDANGLFYELWPQENDSRRGDYRELARRLREFVMYLSSAGVRPIFIFDGFTYFPFPDSKISDCFPFAVEIVSGLLL
jgi:hypothetical protein